MVNAGRAFHLPVALKLSLMAGGIILAFELSRASDAEPKQDWGLADVVTLTFLCRSGREIGHIEVTGPLAAVFVPRGTSLIAARPSLQLRIGFFPRSKIGLKLHAFFNGTFPELAFHRRWRAAGAAARDLRGVHATLLEGSAARKKEQALRYRRYRALYVEDFDAVVPARADLKLSFLSVLEGTVAAAQARLAMLHAQTDPEWRWIAALPDDAPPELATWVSAYLGSDPRTQVVATPTGGADALNALRALTEDGLVADLPWNGQPTRDAVAMIRAAFDAHPDCRVAYTDEERRDAEDLPASGVFKPAYNRHLLRAGDYLGDIVVFRADYLAALGGIRPEFGNAARYHLRLRALEGLPPSAVRHIPRVAFSTPDDGSEIGLTRDTENGARALEDVSGLKIDVGADGRFHPLIEVRDPAPLVSIVIPTRDRSDLMRVALRSLIDITRYRNFEIVIVDNGSVEPETFALFEEIKAIWPNTLVVRDNGPFNYPRICNAGVAASAGSLICLLNNDIEIVEQQWLEEMVALAMEPRTGVVGAKLLFPDRTTQHVGVIVGLFRYAAHWFAHAAADAPGPHGRLACRTNMSAVTGACLMIRRNCWDYIGPLDAERFAEDCNDIDLCLRARHAGFEVVWTPFACLVHHESASRGRRRSRSHRKRLKEQRRRMEDLWGTRTMVDPHYNPNLSRTSLHAALAITPEGNRDSRTDEVAYGGPRP